MIYCMSRTIQLGRVMAPGAWSNALRSSARRQPSESGFWEAAALAGWVSVRYAASDRRVRARARGISVAVSVPVGRAANTGGEIALAGSPGRDQLLPFGVDAVAGHEAVPPDLPARHLAPHHCDLLSDPYSWAASALVCAGAPVSPERWGRVRSGRVGSARRGGRRDGCHKGM